MELRIATQLAPGVLPEIEWNNEELKNEVAAKAAEYKNIAYTEDQSADMKKDRVKLNKLVTAFEDQRKQVKRFYNEPYEKFEGQVKEVLLPVREAIGIIDNGLGEIERKYRLDKKNKMRELYDAYVGDLKGIVSFEKTVREEWYKKAFTEKKIEQGYKDQFCRINEDMQALDQLPERFRSKAVLKYTESLNLSEAMREGKRLEEAEKALEERRKRMEEEKAARLEASKKQQEVRNGLKIPEAAPQTEAAECKAVKEPVMYLDFRAWGTREQLMGLRKYMIDNHINFGKVE